MGSSNQRSGTVFGIGVVSTMPVGSFGRAKAP